MTNRYLDTMTKVAAEKFQPVTPSRKGDLHTALGIPQDKPIPTSRIKRELAKVKSGSRLQKMLQFALTSRSWHHV